MTKFVCHAPWVSLAFQPTGVAPCCWYELDQLEALGDRVIDATQSVRDQFLNNQVPSGCKKCYQNYQDGIPTYARSFDQYPTDFATVEIQEINIKANNLCNLKCRSCGPHFSSKWEEEIQGVIKITKDSDISSKLSQINFDKLKFIVFAGGEPTMQSEHVQVLQYLIEQKLTDVKIRISTNLHTLKFKSIDLLSLWKNFPNLVLQVSIDAVGDQAEYIRSDTSWNTVSKNLEQLINSNINFYANITVSALNIWFLKTTIANLTAGGVKNIKFIWLSNPDILSLDVIPEQYTEDLIQQLQELQPLHPELRIAIKKLNSNNQHLWSHFLVYNLLLDQTRNEKLIPSLPIIDDIKHQWISNVL